MKRVIQAINKLSRFAVGDEGSTLAEMAIMVPFLAVMLGGVSEFGRFFQTHTTLAKSTRTAARYLSNHPFNDTEKARARNLAVCGKLTCAGGDELLPDLTTANVCIESSPGCTCSHNYYGKDSLSGRRPLRLSLLLSTCL